MPFAQVQGSIVNYRSFLVALGKINLHLTLAVPTLVNLFSESFARNTLLPCSL